MSWKAARRSSSRPAWPPRPRSLLAFARPGATVALAEGAYFGTSVLLRTLEPWGLRYVEYDQTGPPPPDADIVWVEAPANPTLTVPDWDAVRAHDGLIVCDATASTPIYLRALDRAPTSSSTPARSS